MPRYCHALQHITLPYSACLLMAVVSAAHASATLQRTPDSYLEQAARVRQAADRPWTPDAGQLGNLRHAQITARDCVVRVVSGTENRVFPGTRNVLVVEQSRVLDSNPNEQPAPRDVVLAPDRQQACPSLGTCGVSITQVSETARVKSLGEVCFTLQLASAHDLLVGGDGLDLVVDRLRQPALRIAVNPSARLRVWLDDVDLGLLSIKANAAVRVGGTGKVDFLQLDSSNSASAMYLHELRAHRIGVSTTTTGSKFSIRIDPETKAGFYQPARAPGAIAELYSIEIDGPIAGLEIPAGRVNSLPLSSATRIAAGELGSLVLTRAGPAAKLPMSDSTLPTAAQAVAALPRDARQILSDVAARYLPSSIQINEVALWKSGGRIEGTAPDAASARKVVQLLNDSGEFTSVSIAQVAPKAGAFFFSVLVNFACDAPGGLSICPAGASATAKAYSQGQVLATIKPLLGTGVTVFDVFLVGTKIYLEAEAPTEVAAREALDRIAQYRGLFTSSTSTYKRSGKAPSAFSATLVLTCAVPPKPEGICVAPPRVAR